MTDVIRDLPRDERPRERLLQHGPQTLSDAELVAVILGSGVPGKNAIQLARELLMGGVRTLRKRDLSTLGSIRGVGPAKVARIAAAVELARRLTSTEPDSDKDMFDASALGQRLVIGYGHATQERLGAALLDTRHRVLKQREIFVGTNDRTLVSTREIVRFALIEHAKGVVIFHNHPSGDPTPSNEDLTFTKKLQQSLLTCDIDLVDHLVIGAHRFHSMREGGDL